MFIGIEHFQDKAGHAVNAGVAAGNDANRLSATRAFHGQTSALDLLRQRQRHAFLAFDQIGNPGEITFIADNRVGAQNRLARLRRQSLRRARTKADDH